MRGSGTIVLTAAVVMSLAGLASGQGGAPLKGPTAPSSMPSKSPPKAPEPGKDAPPADKGSEAAKSLKVGDAAPKISVDEWVKGEEVKEFKRGHVYVVEFWATWCGPCVASIPHMTELQKKYKDTVTIVGVAASERQKGSADDRLRNLRTFVTGQGSKMSYTVGFDSDRSMSADWMVPAKRTTIPTAFIVGGDGKVAWIGSVGGDEAKKEFDKALADAVKAAKPAEKKDSGKDKTRRGAMLPRFDATGPMLAAVWQDGAAAKNDGGAKKDGAKKQAAAPADSGVLMVGSKAPELKVGKFVKGEPVTGFEKGKVYVVEFWATWCPPCRESIPHLTELQAKFKDAGLTVVGVSVWERDQSKVGPFVDKMGEKMAYTVAVDAVPEGKEPDQGAMAQTWMMAAKQEGIPAAFVVNQEGVIAWVGNPLEEDSPTLEEAVEQVLAKKWDVAKEKARAQKVLEIEAQLKPIWEKIAAAAADQNWADLSKVLDEAIKLDPDRFGVMKVLATINGAKDEAGGYKIATELLNGALKDRPAPLETLAGFIAMDQNLKNRDLDLAMKLATRANELTGNNSARNLSTLAAVMFAKGDVDGAAATQRRAIEKAKPGSEKQKMETLLKRYTPPAPGGEKK